MATIAFLLGNDFEDSEFRYPFDAATRAGHVVKVVGQEANTTVTGYHQQELVKIDDVVTLHDINDYDALVIPGGYSPDHLRTNPDVVDFVRAFYESGKIVAAVCHGPSLLIEAGVVRGQTLTSWPSVKTDLINAGANWVDQEVAIDGPLITSRKPADLAAFSTAIMKALEPGSAAHLEEQALAQKRQFDRSLGQ